MRLRIRSVIIVIKDAKLAKDLVLHVYHAIKPR